MFLTRLISYCDLITKVLDATKAFSLTIDDGDIMKGVPNSAKAMWAKSHQDYLFQNRENGKEDPSVDKDLGPWRVTLDGPSYINAMQFLPDRNTRKEIYLA